MNIKITDDLDLEKIAESGQCFRWEKKDSSSFLVIHASKSVMIRSLGDGRYDFSCSKEEFSDTWHDYLDLDEDYASIRTKIKKEDDPFLFSACEYGKGIRILRQDPWETLISFIISQNRNIPAIKKSIALLCEAAGDLKSDCEGNPYHAFPTPEQILSLGDEQLSDCRLGYRCSYVRAAAKEVASGRLELEKLMESDEETTLKVLMSVKGIGAKVASCVSLFGLHHVDAFPIDVWIRRILENEYKDGAYQMESYRPYNGIYQQYMFYYYRSINA